MTNDTGSILADAIGAFRKPGMDQAQPFLHLQFHGNFLPKSATLRGRRQFMTHDCPQLTGMGRNCALVSKDI